MAELRTKDHDSDAEFLEDGDRLLIRPYIRQGGGAADGHVPPAPAATVPAPDHPPVPESEVETTAEHPVAETHPAVTLVLPLPPGTELSTAGAPRRLRPLRLAGVGGAAAVALAAGVFLLWPDGTGSASFVGLPAGPGPLAAGPPPGARASVPPTPVTASPSHPSATASVASPSAVRASSRGPAAPASAPLPAPAPTTPAPTLAPPPASSRVGAITGVGGRCLDAQSGIAIIGSRLSVNECNNTFSQRWTIAADGTLRAGGSCAEAVDGTSVRLAVCDSAEIAQWRAGSDGSLVNLGAGRCLADSAARAGVPVGLTSCGNGAGQRWSLP